MPTCIPMNFEQKNMHLFRIFASIAVGINTSEFIINLSHCFKGCRVL